MAHGRARDEHKERQWRQWIAEWRASGLTGYPERYALRKNKASEGVASEEPTAGP
jgi:hypothetical protein